MLSAADAATFGDHLPDCEQCREAVRFEEQLRQEVRAEQLEIVAPLQLIRRTKELDSLERWNRRVAWATGLCAAVLLLVVGRVWLRTGAPALPPDVVVKLPAEPPVPQPAEQPAPEPPFVQVIDVARLEEGKAQVRMLPTAGGQQYLAVPQPTRDARVTFVMLYPTVRRADDQTTDNPPASP